MEGGGSYGALIGGAASLASGLFGGSPKAPDVHHVNLDSITSGQDEFLKQGELLPQVSQVAQQANDLSNEMFQHNLEKFAPDLEKTTGQIGRNASELLAGGVPMAVGRGAGFNGANLTARDLGLTSDDLINQGIGMAGASQKQARALNPFERGVSGTLLTPGALLSRRDSAAYHNNDIDNQQEQINTQAKQINPFMSALTAAGGSLMGGMGGI